MGGEFTKEDQLCIDIRLLQQRSKCSDKTCDEILWIFSKHLGIVRNNFRNTDKKMRKVAGTSVLRLHGCVGCHKHVFLPQDKNIVCPLCGHARYDVEKKPFEVTSVNICEVKSHLRPHLPLFILWFLILKLFYTAQQRVFYFPLKPKLEALLRTDHYRQLCEHEFLRPCGDKDGNLMSDIYDTPSWKEFMGASVTPNRRIGTCWLVDIGMCWLVVRT